MKLSIKQKWIHRHRKPTYGYQKGKREINQEFGINRYTLLYTKQVITKEPLYSTDNYVQYLVITYNGRESEKGYVYTYIYMYAYMTLNRNRPSDIENSLIVTKRERWEGDKFGVWI